MENNNNKQDWQIMKNNKGTETNKNKTETQNVTKIVLLQVFLFKNMPPFGLDVPLN